MTGESLPPNRSISGLSQEEMSAHPPAPLRWNMAGEGLQSECLPGLANSHLQLCCLVDMVLGTGKPGFPLMRVGCFWGKEALFLWHGNFPHPPALLRGIVELFV